MLTDLLVSSSIVRSAALVDADLGDEVVALSLESGECYALNPVAARIWKLIGQPIRVADLCARLLDEYDVDAATCEAQVLAWLEEMRAEGLLTARTEPSPHGS